VQFTEQGTIDNERYTVVPRTLSFVQCEDALLMLRGAPGKRLWANQLNGLGGHLEPGEDPYGGALREIREEAGIQPASLYLRGLVHVSGQATHPGVLLFVYLGRVATRQVHCSNEGTLEWHPLRALPWDEMVPDLPHLLPRLLDAPQGSMLYAVYDAASDGTLCFHWREAEGGR